MMSANDIKANIKQQEIKWKKAVMHDRSYLSTVPNLSIAIYAYGFMWIFSYLPYLLLVVDEDLEKIDLFNLQVCARRCGL